MTDATAAAAATNAAPCSPPEAVADDAPRTARELVLDHLTDTAEAGAQSVDQIMAGTGLTSRDATHQALHRATEAGLIERVGVGVYRIAPLKPPQPPKPAAPPPPTEPPCVREGHTDEEWFALIETYHTTGQWDQERDGPPPDAFGNKVRRDALKQARARLGRRHASCGAVQQSHAQFHLQPPHCLAQAGGGHAVHPRPVAKSAGPHDRDESGEIVQFYRLCP